MWQQREEWSAGKCDRGQEVDPKGAGERGSRRQERRRFPYGTRDRAGEG